MPSTRLKSLVSYYRAVRFAGLPWEWDLQGGKPYFLTSNPVLRLPFWSARVRFWMPVVGGLAAGSGLGMWWGWGGGVSWAARALAGEAVVLLAILAFSYWTFRKWMVAERLNDLELTFLSDGELAHGLWSGTLLPVTRWIWSVGVGEAATVAVISCQRLLPGADASLGPFEAAQLVLYAPILLAFHAATCAMLGPRVAFHVAQSSRSTDLVGRIAATLLECYGLLVLLALFFLFLSLFAGFVLLPFGASIPLVMLSLTLLACAHFKRKLSESYSFALQSCWRIWVGVSREQRNARGRKS